MAGKKVWRMAASGPSPQQINSQGSGSSPVFRILSAIGGLRVAVFVNAFVLRFAGSRYLRLYGVVQHRGRRSGRSYATPVFVRPTADGLVMPLGLGEEAEWFQNLRAAGGGVVRWNGREHPVADPVVVDRAAAPRYFRRLAWLPVMLGGFRRFVRVRHAAPQA
jgi:deazaflavin-dependent oxidoreductase (nitroreductase family)